jgi:eukaryotic-like serine/threonine-protein kinase
MTAPVTAPRDRTLGDYQLLAKLATGGMAEIYLARRIRPAGPGPIEVIKRILLHLADDQHFVSMFRDEANLAKQLHHPNICEVHQLGHAGDEWFIVMEYLHGVALSRLLSQLSKRRQFLDLRIVAGLLVQACEGLHYAHDARGADGYPLRIVHRDVSPPNIVVTSDGVVKLVDFGIAKARGANSKTRTGTVKGKNAYMSPEQILGKPLDRRSDVFALAAVMYELLSVRRLFHRDNDFMTFKAITEEPIPDIRDRRADLPAALVAVLTQALARDPAARFSTAAAMGAAIKAAVDPVGGPATAAEIQGMLARDFGDELTSKDQLVAQVAALDADAAPLPVAGTQTSPTPVASMVALAADDGEFLNRTPVAKGVRAAAPPTPRADPVAPTTALVPSSVAAAPSQITMLELPEGSTDLLRDRRRRAQRLLGGGAAVTGVAVIAFWFGRSGTSERPPTAAVEAGTGIDAGLSGPLDAGLLDAPIDADSARADIVALARFGFFSIGSEAPAVIFIDHKRVGTAPLLRYPLPPGPHAIKAVGPHGKARRWEIIIESTKDVDLGVVDW